MKQVLFRLRAVCFLLALGASLALFMPTLAMLFPLPLSVRYRYCNVWTRFFVWNSRVIGGVGCRIQGLESLPDAACIYLSKHQSAWESLAFQYLLPHYAWIVKKELLRIPFLGWGLSSMEAIAIDRGAGQRAMEQIIEQGRARLNRGIGVLIFPEGTRIAPGQDAPFRIGGAVLAAATGAPVVPVAHNAGMFWPPRKLLFQRPGTIDVRVGKPFDPDGMSPREIMDKAEQWVKQTTRELEASADANHCIALN